MRLVYHLQVEQWNLRRGRVVFPFPPQLDPVPLEPPHHFGILVTGPPSADEEGRLFLSGGEDAVGVEFVVGSRILHMERDVRWDRGVAHESSEVGDRERGE